jgi:hypothetical protein
MIRSREWPMVAQRFHTQALDEKNQKVRAHFSTPYIVLVGSYEKCSCGFNYGREYPDYEDDKDHLLVARESVIELVSYIRNNNVKEIYSCELDDEALPKESERTVMVEELLLSTFVFKQKELLHITKSPNPVFNTDLGDTTHLSSG